MSRNTAGVLRQVGFEGRTFAVEHFGRVIGFLVPVEGRKPVKAGRKIVYDVPEPDPLLELSEVELSIVRTIHELGTASLDRLIGNRTFTEVAVVLAKLEATRPPLVVKKWGGYKLTGAGERHAEELGL